MTPIRSILASRAVITSLSLLSCLALFLYTINLQPEFHNNNLKHNDIINNDIINNDIINNDIINNDHKNVNKMPSHELKGVDGDKVYRGRPRRSTHLILQQAEGFYQRILRQRKKWLAEQHHGTSSFRPWNDLFWWWYFPASFACPHDIQRVGPLSDGGKWICGMSLYEEEPRSKCVIYSFGVNYETRFEGEMLDRTDCEIWAYDASVAEMGPETRGRPNVLFKPYFVGDRDYVDNKGIQWRTLRSLMNENGHDWIDILKVDIEGSEYATFNSIMEDFDVLPFSQLQIELHVDTKHTTFDNFLTWWERLEAKGLRPFWTEVNLHPAINYATPWASEYCFINTRGEKNTLLRDYE